MKPHQLALAAVAALLVAGCSASPRCVPGDSKACAGPGGCAGGQVCQSDGTYAACDCGATGPDSGVDAGVDDAGVDAGPPPPCDVLGQLGCAAGQRCVWLASGATRCVAQGAQRVGMACSRGDAGDDDCQGGSFCRGEICEALCSADAGAPGCAAGWGCFLYGGLFTTDGGASFAGLCEPTCDPVTQRRATDGAPACGSLDASVPELGCFGLVDGPYQCAKVVNPDAGSDAVVSPPFYLNSCAPGFGLLLSDGTGSGDALCSAYCLPAPTSTSSPENARGLPDSGYTCPDRGAAGTHECRYTWLWQTAPSALGDRVGVCEDYLRYRYDSGGGVMRPFPSCTTLSASAHTFDPALTDTQFWGCEPSP